jgi:hypothetical protein
MAFICINVKISQVIGIGPQDAILLVKTISGSSDAGFALRWLARVMFLEIWLDAAHYSGSIAK